MPSTWLVGEFTSNYAEYLVNGPISQRHGSADPDPDPDPPQNVMDPQHCL
jgi:hypothetical protein